MQLAKFRNSFPIIAKSGLLKHIEPNSSTLKQINIKWTKEKINDRLRVQYIYALADKIIKDYCAIKAYRIDALVIGHATHRSIVKPENPGDDSYLELRKFLLSKEFYNTSERSANAKKKRGMFHLACSDPYADDSSRNGR